jgi:hypothetical protein
MALCPVSNSAGKARGEDQPSGFNSTSAAIFSGFFVRGSASDMITFILTNGLLFYAKGHFYADILEFCRIRPIIE